MSGPWEDYGSTTTEAPPWEDFKQPTGLAPDEKLPAYDTSGKPKFVSPIPLGPGGPPEPVGLEGMAQGFNIAGRALVGGAADVGKVFFRPITDELYPEQATQATIPDMMENISKAADTKVPLPASDLRSLPLPAQFVGHTAQGLVESVPKLAAVSAMQAGGIPAPVGAGLVFGATEEGFDPKQAAIAAALPAVGRVSGGTVGTVAKILGVESPAALNWMKGIAGTAGPASAMLIQGEHEISKLPKEQQDQARQNLWESIAGQAALGPMGVKFERPTLKGVPNARSQRQAAEIYGNVPPQPEQGAGKVSEQKGGARVQPQTPEDAKTRQQGVLLSEDDYAEAERKAIEEAEKLGSPATVGDTFTGESPDEPFAGQFMRPTKTGMEIRRANFRDWLSRIAPERRAEAITQRVLEEHIHRQVENPDAKAYWNTLTGLEKAIEHRAYTGEWTANALEGKRGVRFSDTQLGHEAIRRRMQRLMGGTSSEIAEAALRERWTLKGLDLLGDMVRNVRENMGREGTKASAEGLRLLSKLDDNLNAARSAITGGQAPAAFDKNAAEKEAARVADMSPADFAAWAKSTGRGPTGAGYDFAKSVGEEGRPILERMAKRQEVEAQEALDQLRGAAKGDQMKLFADMSARSARKQFFDEGLRLLDAGKAVDGGMSPEAAAQEHGVDLNDVRELASKQGAERPAAFQKTKAEKDLDAALPGWREIYNTEAERDQPANVQRLLNAVHQEDFDKLKRETGPDYFTEGTAGMPERPAYFKGEGDWQRPAAFQKEGDEFLETERFPTGEDAAARIAGLEQQAKDALAAGDRGLSEMIYGEVDRMKRAFPDWQQRAFPAAYQKELGLGEAKKGEERPTAVGMGAKPRAVLSIPAAAEQHMATATGDQITFKAFKKAIQAASDAAYQDLPQKSRPKVQPGQLFETYQNALYKRLLGSSGAELEALAKEQGVKTGRISDPAPRRAMLETEGATPEAREQLESERKTGSVRERYRNRAIGRIADSLLSEAAPEAKPPSITNVSPDDLRRTTDPDKPAFFDVTADDLKNPTVLAERLVQDARRSGNDPVSLTKRLTAILDKQTGKVSLVSTYPHGRSGAMLLDPSVTGIRAHRPLFQMLARFRPIASLLLDEPVQNFKETFESVGEFEAKLATDARTASQHTFEEPPAVEGEFQPGPTTGRYATPGQFMEGRGMLSTRRPITDAEATAVLDHITSEVGRFDSPDDVKASLAALKETTNRQALQGFRTLVRELERKYPDASTEELLDRLAANIYENHQQSQTVEEFVSRTMAQGTPESGQALAGPPQPPAVQGAPTRPAFPEYQPGIARPPFRSPYRAPQAAPPPGGGMLPGQARLAVRARAEAAFPSAPTEVVPAPELAARGIEISPYARGERPGMRQGLNIARIRTRPNAPRGTIPPGKETPAAFNKLKEAAKEQWDITADDMRTLLTRRDTKQAIAQNLDGSDNASRQISLNAKQAIINASTRPGFTHSINPLSPEFKAQRAEAQEALARRRAAIPYIAAGQTDAHGNWSANKSKLIDWRAKLDIAEAKARSWTQDINPFKRREGRGWLKDVQQMQADVEYADAHWSDRVFVEGAQEYRKQIHDAIAFEQMHGATTVERDNYIPGLMKGIYYAGRRMLGTKYRMPKKFQNPYDAIAAGPYRLASLDVADLADTRILTGRRSVERQLWAQSMMGMKDGPTGKPVAKQPVMVMKNVVDLETGENVKEPSWQSPGIDYELVRTREGAKPIAVLKGYDRLVRTLMRPSVIEDLPLGKEALATTGILKHGVILLFDSFHPMRLSQYMAALTGFKGYGWRGGSSALSYSAPELQRAVERGYISQGAADWALGEVDVSVPQTRRTATGTTTTPGTMKMTRKAIADELIRRGLNASKVTDALYKDAVQNIPLLGEPYHKLISPYNKLLFDRFLPGLMIEAAVRNFEVLNKKNPGVPIERLARDVIRDINIDFGNMGRQGIFKSATFRDMAQLVMLAPMWQEGLLMKELTGATRLGMAPIKAAAQAMGTDIPYRRGLPTLGATGKMMARGLGTYIVLTQLINLITRKKFTFQNEEEHHKWDAFLPIGERGVWLSPLSVFAETTHDYMRLGETHPGTFDRIVKMGENRLGPVGKMADIFWTGNAPTGEKYSTSGGRLAGGLSQVTPFAGAAPITFGVPGREIGSRLFPKAISPNPPGAVPRQLLASFGGVKTQAVGTSVNETFNLARSFMDREGLKKDTGWQQVMTEEPSYSKLRRAIRNGDQPGAASTLKALQKTHTDAEIIKAMRLWAKRPFTGSRKNESLFLQSLSDKQLDIYTRANEERMETLNQFFDWLNQQP